MLTCVIAIVAFREPKSLLFIDVERTRGDRTLAHYDRVAHRPSPFGVCPYEPDRGFEMRQVSRGAMRPLQASQRSISASTPSRRWVLSERGEAATMIVSVMIAEAATCVAIVALKSPELGALFLAAGVASGWRWAEAHKRRLQAHAERRLRVANTLLAGHSHREAWDAAKDVAASACTRALRNA